jgi:hypothetical protein
VQLFEGFPGKKNYLNRSFKRKVMSVLKRTLRIRFCGGGNWIGCELVDWWMEIFL